MANFNTQLEKAKQLQPEIVSKELFDFIKSMSVLMVEMNKKQINQDSQDIYGKAIGYYSKATELITNGTKGAGKPFTGKDTGSWLNAFYVSFIGDTFFFGSTDPKTDDILDSPNWLSSSLFGLTDENLTELIQSKILPFILNYYRKELGL